MPQVWGKASESAVPCHPQYGQIVREGWVEKDHQLAGPGHSQTCSWISSSKVICRVKMCWSEMSYVLGGRDNVSLGFLVL